MNNTSSKYTDALFKKIIKALNDREKEHKKLMESIVLDDSAWDKSNNHQTNFLTHGRHISIFCV